MFVAYLVAAELGDALTPANDPFVGFWLPSGIFIGFLIAMPYRRWPALVLAVAAADLVFDGSHHRRWIVVAGFILANVCEGVAGAALYRAFCGRRSPLKRERDLLAFFVGPCLLGPAVAATVGQGVLHLTHADVHEASVWIRWWLGDMIGVLLIAPLVVWCYERRERDGIRRAWADYALITAATIPIFWFAFVREPGLAAPWKFLLLLLTVWAGMRLDVLALLIFNAVLGTVSTWIYERLNGGETSVALDRAATLWLGFIGSCAAVGLTIAMLRRQSGRDASALRTASERFKLAHVFGRTGVWDWDFSTNRLDWSEEHMALWGLDPRDFDGRYELFERSVHRDDLPALNQALAQARDTFGELACDFRIVRPDGTVRWMSARGKVRHDDSGHVGGLIGVVQDITERKEAEQLLRGMQVALAESQSLLNAIINSTEDFIWSVDPKKFEVQTFNRSIERYFAEERQLALRAGHALKDLFPDPKFVASWCDMYRQALARGGLETEYATFSGRQVLHLRMHLLRSGDALTGIAVFARNVTAQKHAEATLRSTQAALIESQTQLNAVLDSTNDLVWSVDAKSFALLTANRAIVDSFQRTNDIALRPGLNLEDMFQTERQRVQWRTFYLRAATSGGFETEYQTVKGNRVLYLKLNPLRRHDRVFAVAVFARDITDERAAQAALRASESQLRLVGSALQAAANAIIITDHTGKIEWVNAAFTTLTGYKSAEAIGNTPRILKSGQHDAAFYSELWATIAAGKTWNGVMRNRRKDGRIYDEEITITPMADADGKVTHHIAVKQDVTERKALETQVRQNQKMEAIGQLAGGIAHDFNNVLAATMLNLNQLQREPQLSAVVRSSLKELELEIKRAAGLTRQLLLFSRRQVVQMKATDLTDVVLNMSRMLRRLIGENVAVAFPNTADAFWVEGDPGMIEQVIMNLCLNARDAMPDGGELTIRLGIEDNRLGSLLRAAERTSPRYVVIEVADTGCGMDGPTLKRLFEPFFTTKEVGRGTGLGLATAYGIVRQHHGWIDVKSTLGRGSTFLVYLPELVPVDAPPSEPPPPTARGGTETILLAEDDTPMRMMMTVTLQSYGYRVLKARDSAEALELWSKQGAEIDLLITDMIMPGKINGAQLAEVLRERRPTLPVIVTSGYTADLCNGNKLRAAGIQYLAKPFTADTLAALVRQLFEARTVASDQIAASPLQS